MRVGVLIELFRDTDIDARFAELRSMGIERSWIRRMRIR